MNKLRKLTSLLLAILILLSLIPLSAIPSYADESDPNIGVVGDGTGSGGGSGSGTFSSDYTGYRMYMIDGSGKRVTNIVDILITNPTSLGKNMVYTYNTKFETLDSSKYKAPSDYKAVLASTLDTHTDIPKPLVYKGNTFVANGANFRDWMMAGALAIKSDPVVNYRPSGGNTSSKPTGGNNSGSTPSTNTPGSGAPTTKPTYSTSRAIKSLNDGYSTWMNFVCARKDKYTRSEAYSFVASSLANRYYSLISYVDWTSAEQEVVRAALAELTDRIDRELPYLGWVGSRPRGGDLNPVLGDSILFTYAANTEVEFDKDKANIVPLLNSNNLFTFYDGVTVCDLVTDTLSQNNLTLVVEAIYWWKPARITTETVDGKKKYVCGTSMSSFFYGTVNGYGQYMTQAAAAGAWTDGGKGGWYSNAINDTGSSALYMNDDYLSEDEATVLISKVTPTGSPQYNSTLAQNKPGWGTHVYFAERPSDQTHTHDKVNFPINEENPDAYSPGPAPDPLTDPQTAEVAAQIPDKLHYRIVKCYEQEVYWVDIDESGELTYELEIYHQYTYEREQTLPKVLIEDELPYYEVVEWKVSHDEYQEVYTGWMGPDTYVSSWDSPEIANQTPSTTMLDGQVSTGNDTAIVNMEKKDDEAADATLYVRLRMKAPVFETRTWDEENYPDGTPAPAPEPPTVDDIPIVVNPELPESMIDFTEIFPLQYRIYKVYRTHNTLDDTYTYDGTFERLNNPDQIQVDDEPLYGLVEYFTSPTEESPATWEETSSYTKSGYAGTTPDTIILREAFKNLYVLLEREYTPIIWDNGQSVDEDLTESQLTKISNTDSSEFGWSGYSFTARIDAARLSHSYTRCVGCTHSCSSDECTHSCDGHCGCPAGAICSHMSREYGDNYVGATFGMEDSWKDRHETTVATPSAHSDFEGKMYGKGGLIQDEILFDATIEDRDYSTTEWKLGSDGSLDQGIEYITTISRASVGDKLNLAKYKQSAMNATSYARINTIFPGANTPTGKRLANGAITESLSYTIGHIKYDDKATSTCSGSPCTCSSNTCAYSSHIPDYDTKYVGYYTSDGGSHDMTLTGSFKVFTYGGLGAKTAKEQPTNLTGHYVTFTDSGEASEHSALYVVPQTATIKYYPYVKMSYMITTDNISFPGYTEPADSNGRTVYMLSDKQSTIIPTNSVEVSWFNKTQADGGYGLQMTSTQWSTHSRAVNGDDGWQGPNQVLPGGALYQLNTKDTESYIKIITYNTLVENDSRQWISVSDSSKYTIDSIINSTQNFLNEAKNVIENFRIVQWVSTKLGTTAWEDTSNSVKIANGGESLSNLGLGGKASTDSKYLLINGTNNQAVNEADIDIEREAYQTTLFKGFTDVDGNVYVAAITVDTSIKMLDKATLTQITNLIKDVCGTNIKSSISGMTSDMSYTIVKIGNKADTLAKILQNLQNNSQYSYLYTIDVKTKFISNLIKSVERNTGSDANATWTTDGKWYNEAFDGIYLVMQTATYKVGIGIPSIRTSVLDPNLCPSKGSTSQLFTNAHMSQFCMDSKSTVAQDEDDHYIGTYEGTKVYLPDLETMYISRPFYIPNANVQDLT